MNIVVSYCYGENYSELAALVKPSLIAYCAKHGYACDIKQIEPDKETGYDYVRVLHTINLLREFDVVFMMEGDFLITNHSYKVEDFINEEHSFFLCKDVNDFNGGSWIAKASAFNDRWLPFVLGQSSKGYKTEQNVFEAYCKLLGFNEGIKTLGHPTINSIKYDEYGESFGYINWEKLNPPPTLPTEAEGNWTPNSFLMHLPGVPYPRRLEIFEQYKDNYKL